MSGVGNQDWGAIRYRIRALLRENGPMTTHQILFALKDAWAEAAVRMALRFEDDDGNIERPSQKQKWVLAK